jgi:predicted carbohydrate-binding protein with CBM5 and CBM33 domain
MQMMKNLDHYNTGAPGNFSVYLLNAAGTSQFLAITPDTAAPSLTLYQTPVTIPANAPTGNYTIQTIYNTDNSGAPAAFYQCSDVQIL